MLDLLPMAKEFVAQLERGEFDKCWAAVSDEAKVNVDPPALAQLRQQLDDALGARRIQGGYTRPDYSTSHVILEGERASGVIHVTFDAAGRVTALGAGPWVVDGIRNIVIGCPAVEGAARRLGEFYAQVLALRIVREDWIKVGADLGVFPHLAFGDGWSDERPPEWPATPAQLHLDVFVRDLEEAGEDAVGAGANLLREGNGWRTYADPFGHPFCVYPDPAPPGDDAARARLARVVLDCEDPARLGAFYMALLDGMWSLVEDTPDRVVIAEGDRLPMLAFQRVSNYVPPRWHDPSRPEQVHLDLHFNEPAEARGRAESAGASVLPPPRGSCPVYADPAGHPLCLCSSGGGEDPPYLRVV